ncbi:MAG: M48 family metallopeptidase [Acetanaerobacterium sp.]
MQRPIQNNDTTPPYRLVRKRIKNIILHVGSDGELWVSAPEGAPRRAIDAFVCSKTEWVLRTRERIAQRVPRQCFDGHTLMLLGERVPVTVLARGIAEVLMNDDGVTVYVPDPEDERQVGRAIDRWLASFSASVFERMGDSTFAPFARMGVPRPQLRLRRMKARWGSCHTQRKVVILNRRLICAPPACIEYVFAHEYAHLVHPNHSGAFYSLLHTVMPDYKKRSAALKDYENVML